jgi:hypothetical protein
MKLSELINKLQRFHDLYPQIDPQVTLTEVAYCSYDKEKKNPEFFCRTVDEITCFELQTFLHIPSDQLFSERGPYLNIFYEGDVIDRPEDYWKNNYFAQHANKQTGSTNSSSCSGPDAGTTVDQQPISEEIEGSYGDK